MEGFQFRVFEGASVPPSSDHKFDDDINNGSHTFSTHAGVNAGEPAADIGHVAKNPVDTSVVAFQNPQQEQEQQQLAEAELRKKMEDSVQRSAMQLSEALAKTNEITQKYLRAITDYVNALESVQNDWRPMVWKEKEEMNNLDSLLPQVKGATSQIPAAPSRMGQS